MAMTYGMALMGKHKRKDLEDIQAEARKQQKRAQKKGLWSSLGGTLGSLAVPLMFGTGIGAPAALALKMGMGYAGRRAGEALAPDVSRKAVREAGEHGFYKDEAERYAAGLKEAQENLNRQQFVGSIVNPLQEYGIVKASKMMGKWAGETELGKGYQEYVDKGGLFGGEGSKLSKTGKFLSSYLPSWLDKAEIEEDYGEWEDEYGVGGSYTN